jgi:DNA-directed RNA polymerase specialized sigma subunit
MKKNPVDEALSAREKLAAERKAEDIRIWEGWKATPTPQTLEPLLKRFDPMIGQHVRLYKAPNVRESALRANLQEQAIKAFGSYDPSRAALSTHVMGGLRKGLRFTRLHQNLARIPEAKAEKIGPIQSSMNELTEQFGRNPNSDEIASHLNEMGRFSKPITGKLVGQIQKSMVKDIPASTFESDPVPRFAAREREVLGLLRPNLTTDEQNVFDHLYGVGGRVRVTSTGELAKKLGKSPSQVSRVKGRIEAQFKKYL